MHLLLVEDNPDLVANLTEFLEALGHTVDVAYNGHAGLGFALAQRYDAMVLDLMLPGVDGLEVCSRLRQAGVAVPILMLTARDSLEDKLEGFASGTDDYLVKPFAMQELEARLHSLVRRASSAPSRRLQVGDLEMDLGLKRVHRAGIPIELPPIAMKLLELLMRRSPEVVDRADLERAIWGDDPPESDALRSHLHQLRGFIDKPFDRPLLHTVRGFGYRLAVDDAP